MPTSVPPGRILIVEDYPDTLRMIAKRFRRAGWDVIEAGDGFEASTFLNSGAVPPDVIVVDLQIPAPSGAALIRTVRMMGIRSRATGRPVRVVAYTGYDQSDPAVIEAVASGPDAVILKPCTEERTTAIIVGKDPGDIPIPPRLN